MLEMKRILKPGGLVVLTSVAYNPVHKLKDVDDFWRFMPDTEGPVDAIRRWYQGLRFVGDRGRNCCES